MMVVYYKKIFKLLEYLNALNFLKCLMLVPFYLIKINGNCKIFLLYGDRFGHFLSNTEYYIQYLEGLSTSKNVKCYFITIQKKLDSLDLLSLLESSYKLKIYYGAHGWAIYIAAKLKSAEISESILHQSEPLILPFISKCNSKIKLRSCDKPYVTLSLRNGNYSSQVQGARIDSSFRDTPIESLSPTIEFLKDEGYEIVLVNRALNSKALERYGVKNVSKYSLEERWSYVKSAHLHIGTSTGFDLTAAFSKTPILFLNGHLGTGLNTKLYTNGYISFVLPMSICDGMNNRVLSTYEMILLLRAVEDNFGVSMIDHPSIMDRYRYVPNSAEEVIIAVKEALDHISHGSIPSDLQVKFWDSYPSTWVNRLYENIVFYDSSDRTDMRISQVFLQKHFDPISTVNR